MIKYTTADNFGIGGIIHINAALDDRSACDVKRLAAWHGIVLLIKSRSKIDDIRIGRTRRIDFQWIGKDHYIIDLHPRSPLQKASLDQRWKMSSYCR